MHVSIALQIVDSPDSEGNGSSDATETENENWCITSIKSSSYTISYFLCVPTTGTRALWASETGALFFKIQTGHFHPLVNVTAILANPVSFPIHSGFRFFFLFLCRSFLFSKDIQTRAGRRRNSRSRRRRWGNHRRTGDEGGRCRERQANQSEQEGEEGGRRFHVDIAAGGWMEGNMLIYE